MEATGEASVVDSVARSGPGTLQEAGAGHLEPGLSDVACADEHFEPVAGDGQVTALAGPPVGSTVGSAMEASTTGSIRDPIAVMASPISVPYIGSAHALAVGASPRDRTVSAAQAGLMYRVFQKN